MLGLPGLLGAASLPSACVRPTPTPIPGEPHVPPGHGATRAPVRVIFLPGFSDRPQRFADHGFPSRLFAAAGDDIDAIALDAHFGYYARGLTWARVYEDVVAPARRAGQRVWLVGISMGGLGALMTARRFPGTIEGVVLLSPYTGKRRTLRAIADAGGARAWSPPPKGGNWTEDLWRWLRAYDPADPSYPAIYLGYGESESGAARAFPLLAELLPAHRVFTTSGEHEWETWTTLWDRIAPVIASDMSDPTRPG